MCRDRLNHIKCIALRVIAEDEFQPDPEDVVVPSEPEEIVEEPEKEPTYIGQRTHMEQTPSGERHRVYEGGGVQLKVCPVCGYANPIHMPICSNCRAIYKELEKIIRKAEKSSKTFDPDNRQHRLALFSNLSHHQMGLNFRKASANPSKVALGAPPNIDDPSRYQLKSPSLEGQGKFNVGTKRTYGPEVLDQIWQNKGITVLGPETITEVVPTNQNRMEKAILDMNSMRDEHGDVVLENGVPKLKETSNWLPLSQVLNEYLSVSDAKAAGAENATFGMDEFYETVSAYNQAHPDEPIGHIDIGSAYHKLPQKDILPEFQGKTEVGSGGRAVLQESVPDSKSAGYYSLWPLDKYMTPSGKPRVGIKQVFADRLAYVEVLRVLAEKAKLERKIEHYKTLAENARNDAKGDENIIKRKKNLSLLHELRTADIEAMDKPQKIKDRLEKTRAHLEKNHGEALDELLDNISAYKEKETKAHDKYIEALQALQKLMNEAQASPSETPATPPAAK